MQRIQCVGAIVRDGGGRDGGGWLLMVQRGHEPQAGRWSLPGGRVEPGETDEQALRREVREETGLEVRPGALVGTVERPAPDGAVFDIRDYEAEVVGGAVAAGDDAMDARWVRVDEVEGLPLTTGLARALGAWGVLGAPGLSAE
jgi:ADP-ribose pyrophosphatase YjhB (NUDIX family)